MGATAVAPITPALMHHFTLDSDASLGVMSSAFALGRLCTTSLWPIASDYIGRRRVLCIAMLGGAVSSAVQGATVSLCWPFGAFLLARGAAGTFSGIVPVLKASIVDSFPPDEVPKVLAYREAAGTFAFVVGPGIGGALAAWYFAAPLYFASASAVLAAWIAAYRIPRGEVRARQAAKVVPVASQAASRQSEGRGAEERKAVRKIASEAAPLLFLSFVWACVRTCFHTYYPLMLVRRYHLSIVNTGGIMTCVSLLVVLVQIGGFERVSRRLGLRGTLSSGALLVSLGLIGVGAAPSGTPLAMFVLLSGLYAVGVALLSPAMPSLLVRAAPKGRVGMLLGIESAMVNFGRILAPPLFGLLHLQRASQVSGVATLAAALLATRIRRTRQQAEPAEGGMV